MPETIQRHADLNRVLVLFGLVTGLGLVSTPPGRAEEPVGFAREIAPILADRCYPCHGPDPGTRKAKLRLDRREDALADRDGGAAFVAGNLDASEAFQRMIAEADDERMPPPKAGKTLSKRELDLIRRWIEQGANWETHWSFVPPARPKLPKVTGPWPRNAIDPFVLDRLRNEKEPLEPAPEATRRTLIRRLSLDLIGLPPTPAEVNAYVNNKATDAYEKVVDRLLHSEHFGERLAMDWLDAARYSDTDGYQGDANRTNWPWRDWVVSAFNRNMPFDQFTLEQFAGDLLPHAAPEQILATGFHRNHMTNGEGGRDPEESRVDYVIDRINTTGTVWLGLTVGCAQCHSHKFDPIEHADYYRLSAFFNSIDEDGRAGTNAKPYLTYESPFAPRAIAEASRALEVQRVRVNAVRLAAEPAFRAWLDHQIEATHQGFQAWRPFMASSLETTGGTTLTQEPDGVIRASDRNPKHEDYRVIGPVPLPRMTGFRLEVLPHPSHTDGGLSRSPTGHFILTDIKVQVQRRNTAQIREITVETALADASADPKKNGGYGDVKQTLDDDPRNGWTALGNDPKQPRVAVFALAEPLVLEADEELVLELRQRSTQGEHNIGRFRLSLTDQPGEPVRTLDPAPLEQLAAARITDATKLDPKLRARLFDQFLNDHPPYEQARRADARAGQHLAAMREAAKTKVMVLAERAKPRETHILLRGVWDKKGEPVSPDVPEIIAPWPKGEAKSRLGLARWLTARQNPLTARVAVNRFWQMLFGAGLVRTPEDFGRQGEPPTHPELLDWLAVEFMESGWDVRQIVRLMVTSATYRQGSEVSETLRTLDPENRRLARGARFRLPSWMIRDAALQASGLLNPAVGGPPVRPYQPAGVWEEISMGRNRYEPSEGADQYRRTLYAFWRRSAAPSFLFDSAQRRVCEVRTPRTNTPLQALTLLNDLTYVEAARVLAERALSGSADEQERLDILTNRVLARPTRERERAVLQREFARARAYYRKHRDEAVRWVSHGQSSVNKDLDAADLAAYTVVANLILNLDEAITRE
ncbi:PSD1 and planctomycete cytochrome C domain-containing protein [Singulisphaera sp. GP187]|uniref:PSD1 and planctomycete cytochrome C domain-containing protein n=1 Tax=Singulisphaera sp. GP187 TaxID=1882752 RepID=UPI000940879E|nr:PSD1 and planctomycete cytochrome C domain-containing protein [Singulisphaera sp. GP187]